MSEAVAVTCDGCGGPGPLCPGRHCAACHAPARRDEPLTFEACCEHPYWTFEERRESLLTRGFGA